MEWCSERHLVVVSVKPLGDEQEDSVGTLDKSRQPKRAPIIGHFKTQRIVVTDYERVFAQSTFMNASVVVPGVPVVGIVSRKNCSAS